MKKLYFTLILIGLLNVTAKAQNIVYNFNTDGDTEGWIKISGSTTVVATGGALVLDDIANNGGIVSPTLAINESNYDLVKVVMENNLTTTQVVTFQLMNYLTGGTAISTAGKTNFSVPVVSGYNTYLVPIAASPNAGGAITAIGIRVKGGDPDIGETLKFDSITIKEVITDTFNGFAQNTDFEDEIGGLASWTLSGTGATVAISNDANSGTQAVEFTYLQTVTSNPPTLWTNYRWPISPIAIGNIETLTVSWDMKSSDGATLVTATPKWKMNIVGSGGDRTTSGAQKTATDSYATYTVTRTISKTCASETSPIEGVNCYDTETYDDIELGITIREGAAGVKVTIDNIVSTISGTTLGVDDIKFKNDESISLFPNPASQKITIEAPSRVKEIQVINVLGQISIIQNGFSNVLDISKLKTGSYILKISQENGTLSTKRLIKK